MVDGAGRDGASARLHRRARRVMPGGVSHELRYVEPHPLYVERAAGAYKWDADGRRYIDYKMGSASQMLGHCPPEVVEAIAAQARRTPFTADCHALEIEWAEQVCALYPSADRVRFTGSGTEATMLALRLGRAHSGRAKVLRIDGHYHGWHDHLLRGARAGVDEPPSLGVPAQIAALTVVAPADAAAVEAALAGDPEIGTVIVEASGASYGSVPLPAGFLSAVRAATESAGAVLVFDEIITGFRWSPGGRQARDRVVPDLTTLAKILTGGLPGGAVAGKAEIMALLDPAERRAGLAPPVSHKGTFNASPLVAAAALAALARLRDGAPQAHADRMAARLRAGLAEILERRQIAGAAYGESSTVHLYLGPCRERSVLGLAPARIRGLPRELTTALRAGLRARGVDLMSHTSGVTSAAHGAEDIDRTVEAFDATLAEVAAAGLLAG